MAFDTTADDVQRAAVTLPYATPSVRAGSPTVAATVIACLGIALILLGGCFLIGVLMCVEGGGAAGAGQILLIIVLYLLAFACFGGALWLLFIAVRRLLGIMRG